jgi:hypothetical protein
LTPPLLPRPQTVDVSAAPTSTYGTDQKGRIEMNEEGLIAGIVPQADGDDANGIIIQGTDGDGSGMADLDIQPCL